MTAATQPRPSPTDVGIDAHWYAADGTAAAVVHAMLVQPARADVSSAIDHEDWPRAMASAAACLRWISLCHELLDGRSTARTGIEVDVAIAAGAGEAPIDAVRDLLVRDAATREEAEDAARAVQAEEAKLGAALPFSLPVRRTPTGYQPAVEIVSQVERLRLRLGLPLFDWEAWTG